MSSAAENNPEVEVAEVKKAGDKVSDYSPATPDTEDLKGTKRPAEVSI